MEIPLLKMKTISWDNFIFSQTFFSSFPCVAINFHRVDVRLQIAPVMRVFNGLWNSLTFWRVQSKVQLAWWANNGGRGGNKIELVRFLLVDESAEPHHPPAGNIIICFSNKSHCQMFLSSSSCNVSRRSSLVPGTSNGTLWFVNGTINFACTNTARGKEIRGTQLNLADAPPVLSYSSFTPFIVLRWRWRRRWWHKLKIRRYGYLPERKLCCIAMPPRTTEAATQRSRRVSETGQTMNVRMNLLLKEKTRSATGRFVGFWSQSSNWVVVLRSALWWAH